MVFLDEVNKMIGHQVSAIGCCGIHNGVLIKGILSKFENGEAIVLIDRGEGKFSLPCLVNENTLKLVEKL
jgi:hypothetical protein